MKNNPAANPKQDGGEEESTKRHVYVEPGVQIDFVKNLREQYKAAQEDNTAHSNKILFWTKVSAGLLFVYAALAWWQGCSTQRSVKIAKDTMTVSQRAFVYAKRTTMAAGEPNEVRPPNIPAQVEVAFGNSGQTQARNESGSINFYFSSGGIPSDFTYPMDNHSQPILIAPQTEAHLFKALTEDQFVSIRDRKTDFFVYGELTYDDVFDHHHRTAYCFEYAGFELNPATGKVVQYIFYEGPTHNCADDDCKTNK